MAAYDTLLPNNATPYELAISDTTDDFVNLVDRFNGVRTATLNPPPQFLPFLVWQYGLGELSPYLPNLYDLIAQGIQWQRLRGTPAAILLGLSWLGYSGELEEAPARRRRWATFQWHLDRVRDNDLPDLARIDGIVALSPPLRSKFVRSYNGYDVRACETSYSRTSESLTSDDSGVYLPNVGAKWSFGRQYDRDATLSESELTDLGVWIEPVPTSGLWVDDHSLWVDDHFLWAIPGVISRLRSMANDIAEQTAYIRFTDASNQVIGYSRAVARAVAPSPTGEYVMGATKWTPRTDTPSAVFMTARTGFGDGAGQTATHIAPFFGATRAVGVKPGKLWLEPDELTGGVAVASYAVSIPLGLTVREFTRFLLRL